MCRCGSLLVSCLLPRLPLLRLESANAPVLYVFVHHLVDGRPPGVPMPEGLLDRARAHGRLQTEAEAAPFTRAIVSPKGRPAWPTAVRSELAGPDVGHYGDTVAVAVASSQRTISAYSTTTVRPMTDSPHNT